MLPSIGWPADTYNQILESINPGTISFVGESHQQKESIQLIQGLLAAKSQRHECLSLALEIDDSQQPVIDQVIKGDEAFSAIKIPEAIDHPGLREFIATLIKAEVQNCVQLIAIDTGIETEYDRNEWMAGRLAALPQDKPILVLLGILHVLKRVNWPVPSGKPSVAEILDRKGFRIKSFVQRWAPKGCLEHEQRKSRYIGANTPEALNLLNNT